jgi:predicted metal-dependent phosphoesterase TrpH
MKADLHMHTTFSDGRKTYQEVMDLAKKNGVDVISITDHDTVRDVEKLKEYAKKIGIRYIPGIELSTIYKGKSVHVLGYFTDESYSNESLLKYTKQIKHDREERARKMIDLLKEHFDIEITYEDVKKEAYGIIARPHIAKAIIKQYPNYTHNQVFDTMIGDECKAYLPSVELGLDEGLKFLDQFSCVKVLAHPILLKKQLRDEVLSRTYDGIEAVYYQNSEDDTEYYKNIAKERGILYTAGTDYHGILYDSKHGEIGACTITGEPLDAFLAKFDE